MNEAIERNNSAINKITDSLVKVYNPEEIYIFGSYAWGEPGEDSDIDFAVIVEDSDLNMADRIRLSVNELWGIGIPADILVFTRKEIEERVHYCSTLQYRIVNEGTKVYEAA